MKKLLLFFTICVFAMAISSCSKVGPQGPAGSDGIDGSDGNANVSSYSYIITQWGYNSGANYHYSDVTAVDGLTSLTSASVESAALLAYIETADGWTSLPTTYSLGNNFNEFYRPYFDVNHFLLKVTRSDGSTQAPSFAAPRNVRIVVIPHNRMNPSINMNDYNAVKTAFNLKD